jgi:hypothetical protein
MLADRFNECWASEAIQVVPARVGSGTFAAFMPCPCPLPAAQQAHAEYVYRVALERAQAEIARERRARWTTFSLN